MPQTATIKNLPEAFEVVKAMQTDGLDWGEGYRPLGRRALAEMDDGRGCRSVARQPRRRRRVRSPQRRLPPQSAERAIELKVPRTRRYCPVSVIRSYARRAPEIDRAILAGFVLGLSTRKVGEALLSLLGRPVSPTTVSRVAKTLDAAVEAFHRRPLTNSYKALMFDGVVLSRKTGAGALKRPVPVVLGLRPDGRKEIVDYRLARAESAAEWERFLDDLYARGLTGEGLEMICVDGGQGLLAALPTAYHGIPVQRCWAHKMCPRQGSQGRSGRRQAGSPRCHERRQPYRGPERRQALRHTLGRCIPQGRRMPARRSRRSADLFPLQGPRSTQAGQNHQRYRAPVPRGPAKNTGRFPGPHLDGPHPVRYLHPRKQTAGNQYPFPADT